MMGIRYAWVDSNEIIMVVYVEYPWSWKEYLEHTEPLMKQIKEKGTPCATIVDISEMKIIPKDGNMLQILMYVDKIMPPNVFASTMVGANPMVMTFMNVLTKIRPNAKRLVSFTRSLKDATELIYKRYHTLYPDSPLSHSQSQPKDS
ncbi:MAG: hypothetical protein KJ043_09870 [Anaerolineae bacterium]|nr:hypothetical protein [Anaerolineae bacterium]